MAIWRIKGGKRLEGSCFVQGSKNAVLPMLAAACVAGAETELMNVPRLSDVTASLDILRCLGCRAELSGNDVYIDSRTLSGNRVPPELSASMRSSILFMGALLSRCGEVHIARPGGCMLGERPIDLHLEVMKSLGAEVFFEEEEIICRAAKLRGAEIRLPIRSVGATENAMLAACGAEGETVITGAAMEPEIVDLQEYLRKLGAYISGAGTDRISVRGFEAENSVGHRVIPDRIAASTILCAAAAAGGDVELLGVDCRHFYQIQYFLNRAGCDIICGKRSARLISDAKLHGVGRIITAPYPGFPTDAQPLLMAALLKAEGESSFEENIFESRYNHVNALRHFGAYIEINDRSARLRGVEKLHASDVKAADLRGGAALLIAGLTAEGESTVTDKGYICRGYELFDRKLRSLGADIIMEI